MSLHSTTCGNTPVLTGESNPFPSDYATLGTIFNRNDLGTVRGPPTLAQGVSPVIQLLPGWGGVGSSNPAFLSAIPYVTVRTAYPAYPASCMNTQSLLGSPTN